MAYGKFQPRKGMHIKINPTRGYGDEMGKVTQVHGHGSRQEVSVDHPVHGRFDIYTAHCYRDAECIRRDMRQ